MESIIFLGINRKYLRYEIILGFLVNVICFVGANAACYAIAYDVDRAGRPMSWYSYPILVITVYCVATLAVQCSVHLLFNRNKKVISLFYRSMHNVNANLTRFLT